MFGLTKNNLTVPDLKILRRNLLSPYHRLLLPSTPLKQVLTKVDFTISLLLFALFAYLSLTALRPFLFNFSADNFLFSFILPP
jgi:hypothetical protein